MQNNNTLSVDHKISDLPAIGKQSRYNNMRDRLSMFFDLTKQMVNDNNQRIYADNRNSKGILVPVFVTLTYPDNTYWKYQDISNFIRKIKKYADYHWSINLRTAWVAETTKNGTIHYHILTWVPRNKRLPKPSEPLVYNNRSYPPLWPHRAKIEGVRKGVFGYLLKYISKGIAHKMDVSQTIDDGYTYQKIKKIINYIPAQSVKSGTNLCLVSSRISRNKIDAFPSYPRSRALFRSSDAHSYNHLFINTKTSIKSYAYVSSTPKKRKVTPRIFGLSGMTKKERELITYYRLPKYVRTAFDHIRVGDRISRVRGGFKLNQLDKAKRVYYFGLKKYRSFCELFIPCNFTKVSYDLNGYSYLCYEFGKSWEVVPDQNFEDVFYPF